MLQEAPLQHHRVVRGALLRASAPDTRGLGAAGIDGTGPAPGASAPLLWDVTIRDGREYDRFDDVDSVYVLGIDEDGQALSGGWRLRPTDRGSMLADVFTQLLEEGPAPRDPSVWEVSRFAMKRDARPVRAARRPCWQARALLREAVRFAIEHRISRYVFVVSLAVERLIAHTGVRVHRFASPVRIGRAWSVACWIDIDAESRRLLRDPSTAAGSPTT